MDCERERERDDTDTETLQEGHSYRSGLKRYTHLEMETITYLRFLRHLGYFNSPWKTKIKPFASVVLDSGDQLCLDPQAGLTVVSYYRYVPLQAIALCY